LHLIPIEFLIGKCDVFHTSDWTQPPTLSAKTIATVHDLTPFLHPEWHHPKVINAHRRKMYWAAKKCSKFICVSQNTQSDLIKLFPKIDPKKTNVVYESAENKYSQFLKLSQKIQQKKKDIIKKQYGLENFILAQGTREPRKNLNRLIEAFICFKKKYPNTKVELAITGKYGWGNDISTKDSNIKILGFIPEKDMVALHASAICLAYPSLYESFGLPIIKSLKVGTPVITSNNSSLKEIAKNCSILVDPTSVDEITKAIEKIRGNPELLDKLKEYKTQKRGGSGIKTMSITKKTGPLVAVHVLDGSEEEVFAISKMGQVIRTSLADISTLSRATQGVRIMKLVVKKLANL
jgi:glycosyltransferase involved in cell wall biosynthesis